jgi:hypothetical protein
MHSPYMFFMYFIFGKKNNFVNDENIKTITNFIIIKKNLQLYITMNMIDVI